MVWRNILRSIGLFLLRKGFDLLFKIIDKDGDGKLSKQEIKEFTNLIKDKLKKIKK